MVLSQTLVPLGCSLQLPSSRRAIFERNLMNATLLYRVAAVLYVLFAAGHTYGFLNFRPPTSEGLAVLDAMNQVHFQVRGADLSYGGFYQGFGLSVTAYLLFSAFLAWHLGSLARKHPQSIGLLGWAFFAVALVNTALSCIYFAAVPTILSCLVALCLGGAALMVRRSKVV
jgi:hypothetical protein